MFPKYVLSSLLICCFAIAGTAYAGLTTSPSLGAYDAGVDLHDAGVVELDAGARASTDVVEVNEATGVVNVHLDAIDYVGIAVAAYALLSVVVASTTTKVDDAILVAIAQRLSFLRPLGAPNGVLGRLSIPGTRPTTVTPQELYEAYCASSNWKNFRGEPCPEWAHLTDPVRRHWGAVAAFVTGDGKA